MSLELLEMLLQQQGLTVVACSSGDQAVEKLRSGAEIDIVLTDLQMPGLRGAALATALRSATSRSLRIFAMSATAPEHRLPGVDGFLLKPFSIDVFMDRLRGSVTHRAAILPTTELLDETIYERMSTAMSAAQLEAMYNLALDDAEKRLVLMRQHLSAKDNGEFRKQAHAAKGGCAMVGASELAGIASQLEHQGLTGTSIDTRLDEFQSALNRMRRMLDQRLKKQ